MIHRTQRRAATRPGHPLQSRGRDPFHRALIDLCFERGFANVTIRDLCGRAGLDRDRFAARYSDLEDCFATVLEECAEEFLTRLTAAYEAEGRWQDRLRAVAYATLRHLEEDPARAHFTVVESFNGGERAQLVRDRVFATLSSYIDDGRHAPGASASISDATAESLNGAVFLQMRVAMENNRSGRFEDVLPELMYAAVLPYLGPEAAAEEIEMAAPRQIAGAERLA
jgi:AcrR family transcriptional regulator